MKYNYPAHPVILLFWRFVRKVSNYMIFCGIYLANGLK